MKNHTDIRFRTYLLEMLQYREITSLQIWRLVQIDYYKIKNISRQYLTNTLRKMTIQGDLSRKRIKKIEDQDDRSRYMYTISDHGQKKLSYYKSLR